MPDLSVKSEAGTETQVRAHWKECNCISLTSTHRGRVCHLDVDCFNYGYHPTLCKIFHGWALCLQDGFKRMHYSALAQSCVTCSL